MDRGLFSNPTRVSRPRNGAVPVSVALHAMAIAAAVLASAAVKPPASAPAPPRPALPPLVTPVVRVSPLPPPPAQARVRKGGPRITRPIAAPTPARVEARAEAAPRLDQIQPVENLVDLGPSLGFSGVADSGATPCVGNDCHETGVSDGPVDGVAPTGPVRAGGNIKAPARLHFVQPRYPAIAVAGRVQGDVQVDCVIASDGQVREARVLSGPVLLQASALDAVRQWRYTPPRLNDTPISVLLTVTVHFRLDRR